MWFVWGTVGAWDCGGFTFTQTCQSKLPWIHNSAILIPLIPRLTPRPVQVLLDEKDSCLNRLIINRYATGLCNLETVLTWARYSQTALQGGDNRIKYKVTCFFPDRDDEVEFESSPAGPVLGVDRRLLKNESIALGVPFETGPTRVPRRSNQTTYLQGSTSHSLVH